MNKETFLAALRTNLESLPLEEVKERVTFYAEMIDDRIEEGLSEEEAIAEIGSVESVTSRILSDSPSLECDQSEKGRTSRRSRTWEIVLLVLGSPLWLSLVLATFGVVISIYASIWSVVVSLWSVCASLVACGFGGILAGALMVVCGYVSSGLAMISGGLVCLGLGILAFLGCRETTRGVVWLTKRMGRAVKRCFVRKERSK